MVMTVGNLGIWETASAVVRKTGRAWLAGASMDLVTPSHAWIQAERGACMLYSSIVCFCTTGFNYSTAQR